ncbi:MAG: helix-turn-helix transcriptional regulator [Bacteroidaceae bacterium]|nr:helix-turn-helix transcriptional regulator [Bacteroidaceae bacterium]
MKERIYKIMQSENMTQREFAQALGISPSSLSSIFNGHTSPTNYTVQAIHRQFPDINIAWLMFGEGEMLSGDSHATDADEAQAVEGAASQTQPAASSPAESLTAQTTPAEAGAPAQVIIRETVKYVDKPQRKIARIHILYDDGTFETFEGGAAK